MALKAEQYASATLASATPYSDMHASVARISATPKGVNERVYNHTKNRYKTQTDVHEPDGRASTSALSVMYSFSILHTALPNDAATVQRRRHAKEK